MDEVTGLVKAFLSGKVDLIGLDIGSYAVKGASVTVSGKSAKIKGWGYEPYNFKANASIEDKKKQMAGALKKMLANARIANKSVCIGVSGNSVIVRYVKIPWMVRTELEMRLRAEAEPFIPFDVNDVNLGFHKIADIKEDGAKKMEIILVAAKREIISTKMEVVSAAGLNPLVIDVDVFALDGLWNQVVAASEELKPGRQAAGADSAPEKRPAVMILNIGHKITNLAIIDNGVTRVARDILIAGATFNKAIAKNLGIETDRADEMKKEFGLDLSIYEQGADKAAPAPDPAAAEAGGGAAPVNGPAGMAAAQSGRQSSAISTIIYEVLKDLVVEVRRSVEFFYSQNADRSIGKVYLCGGSANLKNIDKFLAVELNTPVEVLNPFSLSSDASDTGPGDDTAPAMAVALGLSLRKMWDWQQ
ncbi:MAG: type IV pilus assembly protein PilM [Elusimicrobiaceae bacterium]|nr:type IV pilus assembly protein PilM [Elusimicrobiaceae bacterium]